MKRSIVFATAALLALSGCAETLNTPAFSPVFADNQAESLAPVLAAIPSAHAARPSNAEGASMIFATTHAPNRKLVAVDLTTGQVKWSAPFDAMTRPENLGDVVVASDRESLVAFDASNGTRLWSAPVGTLAYVGAARSEQTLVYVLSVGAGGGATRIGEAHAVNARTGASLWKQSVTGVLGRPAATGGYLFLPWDSQNLAILNLATGIEEARVRSTDDVIAWVRAAHDGVYYGSPTDVYALDSRSISGKKTGSTFVAPHLAGLPGDPVVTPNGFLPMPGTRSARGRIRAYLEPQLNGGALSIVGNTIFYTYFRYLFAFDIEGNAKWTRILDQDVIAAEETPGGLLVADERGTLRLLDAVTGAEKWHLSTNLELDAALLDAPTFAPSGTAGEAKDLRTSLTEIALDPDNRLVPARAFAISLLARIQDPEITRDLLDLYAQRAMTNTLREAIGNALRTRRTGTQYLVEALSRSYDFLEGSASPPLQVIVPALVEANERSAVNGLLSQLMDHETPTAVLPALINAIVQLGDASSAPVLKSFVVLYHGDSALRETPEVLTAAAEGVFKLGGTDGRATLQKLAGESSTPATVATAIHQLFDTDEQQRDARARAEAQAAEVALRDAARHAYDSLPQRLTQEQINQTFGAHIEEIRGCVMDELGRNPELAQVRFLFIMNNDGTAREFTYAPNSAEFVACVRPKIATIEFPRFKDIRQRGVFTIGVRAGHGADASHSADADAAHQDAQHWWSRNARLAANSSPVTTGLPWWVRRAAPVQATPETTAVAAQPTATATTTTPATTATQTPTATTTTVPATATPGTTAPAQPAADENQWWLPQE